MDLSVVVPIFNERENIHLSYAAISKALAPLGQSFEVIFVNDGSTDGSGAELIALARADSRVRVIEFRANFGQSAAMHAGIQAASGAIVITMDGDLQNDPDDIPMMIAKIGEGYDLVHGWRKDRRDAAVNRVLPSKVANFLISRATGFPVHDLGCTLKAIRLDVAQELELFAEMHRFIPILAHRRGARCAEVVTKHHPRRFGKTKYGIGRAWRVALDLVTVKYLSEYYIQPMRMFGMTGVACVLGGMLASVVAVASRLTAGVPLLTNPFLLLGLLAPILGAHFFGVGLLAEIAGRTYLNSARRVPYDIRTVINFDIQNELPIVQPTARRAA